MKNSIFTLILSLFLIFLTLEAKAQGDITVSLKLPPAGTLNIKDFWEVTLINNTNSEQSVYLVGTATEEKDGLIARGTTVPFKLKTGTTILQIKDLPKTPDVEYTVRDPRYKKSLIRQGEFPAGVYEICVSVKNSKNNEEEGSDCFSQTVLETGILSLITPSDGQEIDLKTPLMFTWSYSGKMPADGYTLKIVEVKKGQTPESAMESNRAFFKNEGIRATTLSYPSSAPKFEKGKKYAWLIKSNEIESEIFSFGIIKGPLDSIKGSPEQLCFLGWQDDYSNPGLWNQVKMGYASPGNCPGIVYYEYPDGNIKVNNGKCFFQYTPDNCDFRIYRDLNNFLINEDSWQADFEFKPDILGSDGTVNHAIFALTSGILNPINANSTTNVNFPCNYSDQDGIIVQYVSPPIVFSTGLRAFSKNGTVIGTSSNVININTQTLYYVRLSRLNDNMGSLAVFSDADRTLHISGSPQFFNISGDITGLNYLQHSNIPEGSIKSFLYGRIDNTCIKKNDVIYVECECCEFITNCSFEQTTPPVPVPGGNNIINLPGWEAGLGSILTGNYSTNTFDIFTTVPNNITGNPLGDITPYDGNNCAGISVGYIGNQYNTESIAAELTGVTSSNTYQVTAKMKIGTVRTSKAEIEVFLYSTADDQWQPIAWMTVWDNTQWQTFDRLVNPRPNIDWDRLVFKGFQGADINTLSYVFIDCVNFCIGPPCVDAISDFTIPSEVCEGDPVLINATNSINADQYLISVEESNINWDRNPETEVSQWILPPYSIPFDPTTDNFDLKQWYINQGKQFQCDKYYRVKVAVSNQCTSWNEMTKLFHVKCCNGCNCECESGILQNWNFTQGIQYGDLDQPGGGTATSWHQFFGTPQVAVTEGGCDVGFIHFWGHSTNGEGINQTSITVQNGKRYKISVCTRLSPLNTGTESYGRIRVRFSNGTFSTYENGGTEAGIIGDPGTTTTPPISVPGITSTDWTNYSFEWVADNDYNTISINPVNDNSGGPNTVSWMNIDNICIYEIQ